MNHPAELAINQYLEDATSGKSTMSEETIEQVGKDVWMLCDASLVVVKGVTSFVYGCPTLVSLLVNSGSLKTSQRKPCHCRPHS